jgi:hypothetical protein
MSLFKRFLLVFLSGLFLLSLSSALFADPDPGEYPPDPPPIMPGDG